jgi:hypothetical protein
MTGPAARAAQVEDGLVHRLRLVRVALSRRVERHPRHGDAAGRQHPRAQRLLARQRLEVAELRAVEDRHRVGRQRVLDGHRRLAGGVEQGLGLLADPEGAALARHVGPRLDDRARGHEGAAAHHLVAVGHEVEASHSLRERGRSLP